MPGADALIRENLTRRQLLSLAGAGTLGALSQRVSLAKAAPVDRVSIAKCPSYGAELLPALSRMFDQLGGVGRLVQNKTVAIKLNLTGDANSRLGHLPAGEAHWVHPRAVAAVVHLLGKAGARRIRLLESPWASAESLEEFMLRAGWEPRDFLNAAPGVEFENTNWLGKAKKYSRLPVPGGGYTFPAFDLNHSYADCDVFVSLTKLKEHATTGITLAMKNSFGITPCTIYGDGAGIDEPSEVPKGGRTLLHFGRRQPSKSAPPENDPSTSRDDRYRVPRIVADLVAARPIHLSIIEGIYTMTKGEGPWIRGSVPVRPGVLVAGLNPVNTDAVATAVMGFDPIADRGKPPFEKCDSTLRLAEDHGLGSRDLSRIDIIGTPIQDVRFDFRKHAQAHVVRGV
ncbi:MAG: DUF362 domain-containing protein [Bryobacteraceae bacterium]